MDGDSGGEAGGPDAGGGDASGDAGDVPCRGVCGTPGCGECPDAEMVTVMTPSGASYEIDATEVTNAQYAAFLATDPALETPDDKCTWNGSFEPSTESRGCDEWEFRPAEQPDHPIVCVDWCDARSFCRWAGKRLCGGLGEPAMAVTDTTNPEVDQWYNACSESGALEFPYGNSYDPTRCVTNDFDGMSLTQEGSDVLLPVRTASDCHGRVAPFDRIFDMNGNAKEWEDACNAGLGPDIRCVVRGGSFRSSQFSASCPNDDGMNTRSWTRDNLGFRCCRG